MGLDGLDFALIAWFGLVGVVLSLLFDGLFCFGLLLFCCVVVPLALFAWLSIVFWLRCC